MTKLSSANFELTQNQLKQLRDHDWFPHPGGAFIELKVEHFRDNLAFEEFCELFMRSDYVKETTVLKLCIIGWNAD